MIFLTDSDKKEYEDSYKKRIKTILDRTDFEYDEVRVEYIEHKRYTYVNIKLNDIYVDYDFEWQKENKKFMDGEFLNYDMLYQGIEHLNNRVREERLKNEL